ncbi:unnamed protein product [Rotaria socialis]|uniref:Uncharacterized protein n=1 Tax=Rotaria socialis TaxID=392032 RepID=A0A820AXT4_9BILA|nr:unnamed protein product [Rotaria socialis]CAF3452560.1 unnamed protein product [Rotaria socialis]CAF4192281.1 unnamed protein product [Rotaria socialis]CAF4460435.1 unnamed protein product [Rotaria socialis]
MFDSSMQPKFSRQQQPNSITMPHYPPITTATTATKVPLLSTIFTQSQCLFGGQGKNAPHNIVYATASSQSVDKNLLDLTTSCNGPGGSLKYETVDMKLPAAFSICDALSSSIEPLTSATRIQTEGFELKPYEVPKKSIDYNQKYYSQDSLQKMISSSGESFRNDRKFRQSPGKTAVIDCSYNRIPMAHKMDADTLIGEFTLTNLIPNFSSQTLVISICMNIDCNGLLEIETEERRSGAKTKFTIDQQNYTVDKKYIEQHLSYVESNPNFHAFCVYDRYPKDSLYMLKGPTINAKINFTSESQIYKGFTLFEKMKQIDLTTLMMNELKRIQLVDGSFDLNQDLADLLSLNMKDFDELKMYLNKQGFNSFALNTQTDIIRLIATGIMLLEFLLQVPVSERNASLVPFDSKQIQLIFHRHLSQALLENIDKMIHFYEQKRLSYDIYCAQLELKYSSWEKFIQYALFHIDI